MDLKIYNLASIELGNQNHRMHTATVNSYETHTSNNSTECGDLGQVLQLINMQCLFMVEKQL